MKTNSFVSSEETSRQFKYISDIRSSLTEDRYVYIQTFGCQQNEADSEKLLGMASAMGYIYTEDAYCADLILINTCAVREHAELKALSITGNFKHCKEKKPSLIIGICGCMVSQEHRLDDIKKKYPYVDFLLGTTLIHRFPEIMHHVLTKKSRAFWIDGNASLIAEGLPTKRLDKSGSAWVSIMYGCNNFCTYCIVPYVRGRERSRMPSDILSEISQLLKDGVKEITLLGQNVNSYAPCTEQKYDFADLLTDICSLEGEAIIHFMTSHPKDANFKLIDVMANNPPKSNRIGISRRFHLPLQSGSDRILKAMNRRYDTKRYLSLIDYMRERIPEITITTDIIVGFPTETEEEFSQTLDILKKVRYDNIYSFIYSKRKGTPAAEMDGQIPEDVKGNRFRRLLDLQSAVSKEKNLEFQNKTLKALVIGKSKTNDQKLTARTENNRLIHFDGDDSLIGSYVELYIERAEMHELFGKLTENTTID